MDSALRSERLEVRPWTIEDAPAAFEVYGSADVAHWLTPAMRQIPDVHAMHSVLEAWVEAAPNLTPPCGRWAVLRRDNGQIVGGLVLRLLPPYEEDVEVSWQLRPDAWGMGYATEAARMLICWAFTQDVDEVFAVARPHNERAIATARRIGMEWVGETDKYYDLKLQVFRIRPSDVE